MKTRIQFLLKLHFLSLLLIASTLNFGAQHNGYNYTENADKDTSDQYIGGNTESDYNYIYWQKPASKNIKFYLLQSSTSSNLSFTKIARINASNNKFVTFKDYNPKTTTYYRLLAFDSLGDFTIYNILRLDRSANINQSFNLMSTKDAHVFYIAYEAENEGPINFVIFKEGKLPIYKNNLTMTKGSNLIKLDLHFLPEGLYSIELQQNKNIYQQQFAMLSIK